MPNECLDCVECTPWSDFERGINFERERIIKLLEDECDDGWPTGVKHLEISLPSLISIIKGENK